MDSKDFLSLMNFSSFMIGNSSAGIREAPSFKLPVINIGTRQNGRLRGENVIDVEHDTKKIEDAINFIIQNEDFKNKIKAIKNPYGDGNAAKKIVEVLENLVIDENLIKKVFIDNHEI